MTTYKARIGRMTLIPSDGGRFELSVGGTLLFSKLAEGRFPDWQEIQKMLEPLAG